MLPENPGPGANAGGPTPGPEYPAPLDFTICPDGQPFLVRSGPGFEWHVTPDPRRVKLVISFAVAGGPVLFRVLEPTESAQLLEWLLRAAEVRDGG